MMQTITFYSYKGGVGRTLLLSHFAEFLAYHGKTVVMVDFDLEAPGLHYKFSVQDKSKLEHYGLVDLIFNYLNDDELPSDIFSYIHDLAIPKNKKFYKNLYLIPAGNSPKPSYTPKFATIPWFNLFYSDDFKYSGTELFLKIKELIYKNYDPDYLLIDSRTGVTDIGYTAVTTLPDKLVCLFNNNRENTDGIFEIISASQNEILRLGSASSPIVLPVLTRVTNDTINDGILPDYRDRDFRKFQKRIQNLKNIENISLLPSDPKMEVLEELLMFTDKTFYERKILKYYINLYKSIDPEIFNEIPEAKQLLSYLEVEDIVGEVTRSKYNPSDLGTRITELHKFNYVKPIYFVNALFEEFSNSISKKIYNKIKIKDKKVVMNQIPQSTVRWDLIYVQMRDGNIDFCEEPYYLTETRSHLIDIVQIANLKTFTCILTKYSSIYNKIKYFQNKNTNISFNELFKSVYKQKENNISIGVIGDHASSKEVYQKLYDFFDSKQIKVFHTEQDLLEWYLKPYFLYSDNLKNKIIDKLFEKSYIKTKVSYNDNILKVFDNKHPNYLSWNELPSKDSKKISKLVNYKFTRPYNKMIICDHAVAKYLIDNINNKFGNKYSDMFITNTNDLKFSFTNVIPVGFMHPKEDGKWRRIISSAISDVFIERYDDIPWSRKNGKKNRNDTNNYLFDVIKSFGFEPLSLEEFKKVLIRDKTYNDALDWNNKFDKVLNDFKDKDII